MPGPRPKESRSAPRSDPPTPTAPRSLVWMATLAAPSTVLGRAHRSSTATRSRLPRRRPRRIRRRGWRRRGNAAGIPAHRRRGGRLAADRDRRRRGRTRSRGRRRRRVHRGGRRDGGDDGLGALIDIIVARCERRRVAGARAAHCFSIKRHTHSNALNYLHER